MSFLDPYEEPDYHYDREEPDDDDDDEPPLFGCACEDAICADITCDICIEAMKALDAEAAGEPPPPPPPTVRAPLPPAPDDDDIPF